MTGVVAAALVATLAGSTAAFADPAQSGPTVADLPSAAPTGPSAATQAAQAQLAALEQQQEVATEQYDAAQSKLSDATVALNEAELRLTVARQRRDAARAKLQDFAAQAYEAGPEGPLGTNAQVLLDAGTDHDVLRGLDYLDSAGASSSQALDELVAAEKAVSAAEQQAKRQHDMQAAAAQSAKNALAALQASVTAQRALVANLQAADAAAYAALVTHNRQSAGANLAAAAQAIEGRALASGAATAANFPGSLTAPQVLQVATTALLEQAAGRRGTAPGVVTGAPTDENVVMGPQAAPVSVSVPGHTGPSGSPAALTAWDGTVVPGLGGGGVGLNGFGPSGAQPASPQAADGVNVAPKLLPPAAGVSQLRAEVAVDTALEQLGKPYVWAAAGPDTFDCSGLTQWAWGHAGVSLGHYTGTQWNEGRLLTANEMLPGDLVLFGTSIHHVGMYLGAGYIINAPHTGDYVKIEPLSDFGDFIGAVRI